MIYMPREAGAGFSPDTADIQPVIQRALEIVRTLRSRNGRMQPGDFKLTSELSQLFRKYPEELHVDGAMKANLDRWSVEAAIQDTSSGSKKGT